jgi:hypothetical protein
MRITILRTLRNGSRDSAVGLATGYGLEDREVGVRVPVGSRIFSSPRRPDPIFWTIIRSNPGRRGGLLSYLDDKSVNFSQLVSQSVS